MSPWQLWGYLGVCREDQDASTPSNRRERAAHKNTIWLLIDEPLGMQKLPGRSAGTKEPGSLSLCLILFFELRFLSALDPVHLKIPEASDTMHP